MEEIEVHIPDHIGKEEQRIIANILNEIKGIKKVEYKTKEDEQKDETIVIIQVNIVQDDSNIIEDVEKIVIGIHEKYQFICKTVLIFVDRDGSLYEVREEQVNEGKKTRLFDIFVKTGIYRKESIRQWYRGQLDKSEQENLAEIALCKQMKSDTKLDDIKVFKLCEDLASGDRPENWCISMIRESASNEEKDSYNNIRLYIPEGYNKSEQDIIVNQICHRLELGSLKKYNEKYFNAITVTVYLGNTLVLDHKQLVLIKNLKGIIQFLRFNEEGLLIRSKDDKIYFFKNLADAKERLTEKGKVYSFRDLSLEKNQNLVFCSIHSTFQRVLYIPKDINDQQLKDVEGILKLYEDIKNSKRDIPDDFSLDIFVDGKFCRRLNKLNFNKDDNTWNTEQIMNGIKERLNEQLNGREYR